MSESNTSGNELLISTILNPDAWTVTLRDLIDLNMRTKYIETVLDSKRREDRKRILEQKKEKIV